MEVYPLERQLIQSARWIKKTHEMGESIVLFLGARTGGLFRSKLLYGTAKYFSPRAFSLLTQYEQFDECHRILFQENFSTGDRENILITSLQGLQLSEADNKLADLIKLGFFNIVISTNTDDLLPRALRQANMSEGQDFHIYTTQQYLSEKIQLDRPCILFQAAGELSGKDDNALKQETSFEQLSSLLQNPILMLGYDPYWDRAINPLLPLEGKELWYVNEETPPAELSQLLQQRQRKYILGGEGTYEYYLRALHWRLTEDSLPDTGPLSWTNSPSQSPRKDVISFSTPISKAIPEKAPTKKEHEEQKKLSHSSQNDKRSDLKHRHCIFISYNKKDKKYLEQFKTHLATYERQKLLKEWDESKIAPGKIWQEETQQALKETRIAILFVSPDFLASEFISDSILPALLRAAEDEGAVILPVILQYCVFEETALYQFQPFNLQTEPLADKRTNERHKVWAELARFITTLGREIDDDPKHE